MKKQQTFIGIRDRCNYSRKVHKTITSPVLSSAKYLFLQSVAEKSEAYNSGLRVGDLITHINSEMVQGLLHTEVLQIMHKSDKVKFKLLYNPLFGSQKVGSVAKSAKASLLRRPLHDVGSTRTLVTLLRP